MTARQQGVTVIQLGLLAELAAVLAAARVRVWLRGGWALDVLLGEIARAHSDIELVTWARRRELLQRLLPAHGFAVAQVFPVQTDFVKRGQTVSVVSVAHGPGGRVVVPGLPTWTWRAGALPARKRALGDFFWRAMSPAQELLDEKEGYAAGTGRAPRPKDLASMEALRALLGRRREGNR